MVQGGVACTLSLTSNGQSVPLDGTDLVALAQVHPSENTYVTFPLANSATVGPGTYDAAINCQKLAGNTISANGRYIRVEALAL